MYTCTVVSWTLFPSVRPVSPRTHTCVYVLADARKRHSLPPSLSKCAGVSQDSFLFLSVSLPLQSHAYRCAKYGKWAEYRGIRPPILKFAAALRPKPQIANINSSFSLLFPVGKKSISCMDPFVGKERMEGGGTSFVIERIQMFDIRGHWKRTVGGGR